MEQPLTGRVTSACPLDCPDSCSLDVHVQDGRVTHLDGNHVNPVTQGFICRKVHRFAEHMYGQERLAQPAIRVGAKGQAAFRTASWDEALDLIAQKFQAARSQFGGESILPFSYGGSNGMLTEECLDARLFRRLEASRLDKKVCAGPTKTTLLAMYGKMPGVAFEDYPQARLIVVWGCNPEVSSIHLVPYIRQAKRNGARLIVIDPRATGLAKQADQHLAVLPGTDGVLALAVIRQLFAAGQADLEFLKTHTHNWQDLQRRASPWTLEAASTVTKIPAAEIARFATDYAQMSPAVIRCGWGLERNRNGGSSVAGVLALPAVAGKFGVTGGGFTLSNSVAWDYRTDSAIAEPPVQTRMINMNRIGQALCEEAAPPIRCLYVYNANPLATCPNQERIRQGLLREDLFCVVHEQVLTDTARYADVLLPATTFLEQHELRRSYGTLITQYALPVIDPWQESRPNYQVFADLIERLGLHRPEDATGPSALAKTILRHSQAMFGNAPERGPDIGSAHGSELGMDCETGFAVDAPCGRHPVQFATVFPGTADRKIQLVPPELDTAAPQGLHTFLPAAERAAYPLVLISPASSKTVSSTFGQLDRELARISIHPSDAASRNLNDGAKVRVWNELGAVHCLARVDAAVRPGVVVLVKGLWSHHTLNGATANALCPDSYTDVAEGACFNDARVQMELLE